MSTRDWLRSHLVLLVASTVLLPGAVWGFVVSRGVSGSVAPVKASPLEQARVLFWDAKRLLPWDTGWQFFTTIGGDAELLGVTFSFPPDARVDVLGPTRVAVTLSGKSTSSVLVGDRGMAGFRSAEILQTTVATLKGHRLRMLHVKRGDVPEGYPAWWGQEHTVAVVDRDDTARVVVTFAPDFSEQQRFLDGLSW